MYKQTLENYKKETDKNYADIRKLSAALAIALVLLVPLSLFTYNAYAQVAGNNTNPDPEENTLAAQLNGLVVAATLLIGTVATIIGLIVKLFKKFAANKIATNETFAKFVDGLSLVSDSLEQTDKGVRDNMDVVGLAIGSLLNNPEIKTKLGTAESQAIIAKVQKEIDAWNTDLQKYYQTINPKLEDDPTLQKLETVKARSVPQ